MIDSCTYCQDAFGPPPVRGTGTDLISSPGITLSGEAPADSVPVAAFHVFAAYATYAPEPSRNVFADFIIEGDDLLHDSFFFVRTCGPQPTAAYEQISLSAQ